MRRLEGKIILIRIHSSAVPNIPFYYSTQMARKCCCYKMCNRRFYSMESRFEDSLLFNFQLVCFCSASYSPILYRSIVLSGFSDGLNSNIFSLPIHRTLDRQQNCQTESSTKFSFSLFSRFSSNSKSFYSNQNVFW